MSSQNTLEGKVAIITGGGRGIGKAIAGAFAAAGADCAIASRKLEVLEGAASEFAGRPGRVLAVQCHVGHEDELERLVARVESELGPVNVLVNNAATNIHLGSLLESTDGQFAKMMEINVLGALRLSRLIAPGMVARKSGSIINVASISGIKPQPGGGVYSMTKAALIMLTRSLAMELGPSGVRVNAIAPGLVKTDFSSYLWKNEANRERFLGQQMLPGLAEPDQIAPAAVYLASDQSSFVTGQVMALDGGTSAR